MHLTQGPFLVVHPAIEAFARSIGHRPTRLRIFVLL
jgi:hypothetical protein